MVLSFKISRIGTPWPPRPNPQPEPPSVPELNQDEVHEHAQLPIIQSPTARKRSVDVLDNDCDVAENSDSSEVSFILNIFPDGYTIVNPSEVHSKQDDPQFLRPYDRRSESMITAIECGYLPVDFLGDDIHCKYINGTVQCEVRDYRKESSESAVNDSTTADFPSITKLSLKMTLDNVAKDIHLISDSTWSYAGLLEAESRTLLAIQPRLYLDPTPNLDRLCRDPTSIKLNLDIRGQRLKRLRQASAPEASNASVRDSRQVTGQPDLVNMVDQNVGQSNLVATRPNNHAAENSNSNVKASRNVTSQPDFINLVDHNFGQSNMVATWPKNDAPESSSSRVRDSRQVTGQPHIVNLVNHNVGQSNMVATWHLNDAPESSNSGVRDTRQVTGQPDLVNLVNHNVGQSNMVANALENSNMRVGDFRVSTSQPAFVNLIEQNVGQNNMIATGPTNRIPNTASSSVSYQSSHQIGVGNLLNMQHHASDINSSSVMSSVNDRRGNHCQVLPTINLNKRGRLTHVNLVGNQHMDNIQSVPQQFTRSNFHKAPWNNMSPNIESNTAGRAFSSVGETQSLTFSANESMQQAQMAENWRSNTPQNTPVISGLGSSSSVRDMIGPSTASYPVYRSMQDRFIVIELLTARYKLNCKKHKIYELKPTVFFSTRQLKQFLINDHDDDDILKDETCKMPLSMSLMGGNINICKTRVLNFVQNERPVAENGFQETPKFHTRLILSERQSDGTVAMHQGDLDDVDYLAEDQLLPTLPNTHKADLLAEQFCILMLRENYHLTGDHLKPKPISTDQSTGGQLNTTPGDFNGWLQHILESDPRESIYVVAEPPIGEASQHIAQPQSRGLFSGLSTVRMHPHMVYNNRESQLQNLILQQQEQSQIQRKMMMGHWIGGNNRSMVGFQRLGTGGDGHTGTRGVSPMMSQNPGGIMGHSGNFSGLQGANRQIHLESGSSSGSSGVLMLGSAVNRVNDMNPMQRNILERLNQNRYMNHQQFQLIKQEPTSHLQAAVLPSQNASSLSPSPLIGRPHQQVGPYHPTL